MEKQSTCWILFVNWANICTGKELGQMNTELVDTDTTGCSITGNNHDPAHMADFFLPRICYCSLEMRVSTCQYQVLNWDFWQLRSEDNHAGCLDSQNYIHWRCCFSEQHLEILLKWCSFLYLHIYFSISHHFFKLS